MADSPADPQSPDRPRKRPRLRERLLLPTVSGKWTVLWLLLCFILTAVLIPLVLKLPKWVEFEIVVGCWWVLWLIVLTKLLYMGEQLADDHKHCPPRDWFGLNREGSGTADISGCGSGADAEGCAVILGLILALVLVWFLIEVAIPVVFLMLYFLVRGMLVRVVHDKPQCRGNFGLSAARGALWATIYTLPLFLTIWFVHYVRLKRGT